MPFGIDLKSFVIGAIFAYFAVPWILGMIGGAGRRTANNGA